MQSTDIPAKFNIPFANNAGAGYIRTIPSTPSGTLGQASLQLGFPPENFSPVSAGGVPPFGQDFNGLHNQETAWCRWAATGSFPPYDATWQAAVGGYPNGACVASLVQVGLVWLSLVDNNVTNPDTGGAGWLRYVQVQTSNTDIYVNGSTGSNSNNGLSPATALQTIQAAVNLAFNFPPSQYTITIHVADGTYNEFIVTPNFSGPKLVITGNSVTPSNVLVSSGTQTTFSIVGPNVVTITNLKIQTSTGGLPANGFAASTGANLSTFNTVSGFVEGAVFLATGGYIGPRNHTFSGNVGSMFYAQFGGLLFLTPSTVYTVSTNITVSISAAQAAQSGSINTGTPLPTFTLTGSVTGPRYLAYLNGTIQTQGGGANYFPGSTAGSTTTGGQYA